MKFKVHVLDAFSGTGKNTGKPFHMATVRGVNVSDREFKLFSDVDMVPHKGKDITLNLVAEPNQQGFSSLRVIGVEEK